ncbi:MAG TPA: hypothetical protein VJ973_07520 [Christiangramia sp.]|nr:hypothetical protein [Christiangramia sp.]
MKHLKIESNLLVCLLIVSVLFQSCSIYHSDNISLEQAVDTNRKVRITTDAGDKLKFRWIENEGGRYYGHTKVSSGTSKKLQSLGVIGKEQGKLYSFGLETLNIDKIQAKNYSGSTLATIGVSVVGLLAIIFAIGGVSMNNSDYDFL